MFFMVMPLFMYSNIQQYSSSKLNFNSFLLITIIALFIGLRDPFASPLYLGDTLFYSNMFMILFKGYSLNNFNDFGFLILMKFSANYLTLQTFYIICALLYLIPTYLAFKKWFGRNAFYCLAIFVVSMSFWNFGINGVRNGVSTSLVIYALSLREHKLKMIAVFLFAASIHKTALLPTAAYLLSFKISNTKLLMRIWFFTIFLTFFLGETIETFVQKLISLNDFTDSKRMRSLFLDEINGTDMRRGFRLDFILYSGFPILIGYFYLFKNKIKDGFYMQLLNVYIMSNIVWLLFIYAAYTNRIAYLSWFLMPIVLIYPLLKYKVYKKQTKVIAYLIFGNLAFTIILFMR